jgi:hypothetical protein
MISITNDRGEEVSRQVVGVGAIPPGEQRKFTFAVEVFTPAGGAEPEPVAKLADGVPGVPVTSGRGR